MLHKKGAKRSKFSEISDNIGCRSQISGTDQDIDSQKTALSTTTRLASDGKI